VDNSKSKKLWDYQQEAGLKLVIEIFKYSEGVNSLGVISDEKTKISI